MYLAEIQCGRGTRAKKPLLRTYKESPTAEHETKVCDRRADHGVIRRSGSGGQKTILPGRLNTPNRNSLLLFFTLQ